ADDLQRALSDIGLHGQFRQRMSLSQLCLADGPIILHVRGQLGPRGGGYGHWVLFLGFDNSGARLYDPPRATDSVDPAELLSIWDGTGIIITQESSSTSTWAPPFEGLAAFAIASSLLVAFRGRRTLVGL